MKRVFNTVPVTAANEISDAFSEGLDNLSDDFDYVVDGFETLARKGKDQERAAMQIMMELNDKVSDAMKQIADLIQ